MDLEHYKYVTVDDAVNLCQPGRWLAKVGLKHAYRSVGTHPDGWRDTGMSWCFNDSKHPTYLYDKRLPFGDRASPMVFHRLAQAISRMMARRGYTVLGISRSLPFHRTNPTSVQSNFWHPVSRLHCQLTNFSFLPLFPLSLLLFFVFFQSALSLQTPDERKKKAVSYCAN